MSRSSRKQEDLKGLIFVASILAIIPLAIVALVQFNLLKRRFMRHDSHFSHITDTPALLKSTAIAMLWIGCPVFLMFYTASGMNTPAGMVLLIVLAVFVLQAGRWLGTQAFGVLIDPEGDRVVLPNRIAHFSLQDWATLKPLWEIGSPCMLTLSDITRLTRKRGTYLYLLGPFGSRTLSFSDKQYRDQAIMDIQQAAGRRLLAPESEFS